MFEPLKPGAKVNIVAPMLPPFDDVDLDARAAHPPGDAEIPKGALLGQVVSVKRSNDQLRLRLKIVRAPTGWVTGEALRYADVSLLDPATGRQYGLLKDSDGKWMEPTSDANEGGRFFLGTIPPKGQVFMSLAFTSPPDSVSSVMLLLPFFGPGGPIKIQGQTGGAGSGSRAAGRTVGLGR